MFISGILAEKKVKGSEAKLGVLVPMWTKQFVGGGPVCQPIGVGQLRSLENNLFGEIVVSLERVFKV